MLTRRRGLHPGFRQARILRWITVALFAIILTGCTINVKAGQSGSPSTSAGKGTTVHVKVLTGQGGSTLVIVPVTINGHGPYDFALDTGASQSLIDHTLAGSLGLPAQGSPQPISGVGGNEPAVPVRINKWNIGAIDLPPSTIASAGLTQLHQGAHIRGLIGSDIWRQFGTITIDYAGSTLTVYRKLASVPLTPSTAMVFSPGILVEDMYSPRGARVSQFN